MVQIAKAAAAYFAPVFALAFALGVLRVTLVAPLTGPVLAVALEGPVVLALAWWIAGRVLWHWPLRPTGRLAMGAIAFVLLMAAELATAIGFGQTPAAFLAAMVTAPGALGLLAQVAFGLLPLIRQPKG